jgi:cell division protein FtsN
METRKEKIQRFAVRRRMKDSSSGVGLLPPLEEGSNRKIFYIAAGAILVALVAFVCGVQMGKTLGELQGSGEPSSRIQDRKGQPPPFRFLEKEKESPPTQGAKPRPSDPGETKKEREGTPLRTGEKAPGEEVPSPPKSSASPAPQEEKETPAKAKYALQVAAFNNPAEAQELVNQLQKKGYNAYQVTGTAAAKGTLHRVRIGHFTSLQEAREFALAFEKKENMKPIIASLQNP